jgi:hypothetical protein
MQFRGTPLRVRIAARELTVLVPTEGFSGAVRVGVGEELRELGAGEQCSFALARATAAAH